MENEHRALNSVVVDRYGRAVSTTTRPKNTSHSGLPPKFSRNFRRIHCQSHKKRLRTYTTDGHLTGSQFLSSLLLRATGWSKNGKIAAQFLVDGRSAGKMGGNFVFFFSENRKWQLTFVRNQKILRQSLGYSTGRVFWIDADAF